MKIQIVILICTSLIGLYHWIYNLDEMSYQYKNGDRKKKVLFAFSSDEDLFVNATTLLKELECDVNRDLKGLCWQILHHFHLGLGSELHISEDFDQIVNIAKRIKTKQELGGNSAQMALRAFKEGADVFLHAVMSEHYFQHLFNSSIQIVPNSFLREQINDVHIVVNFQQGDNYQGIICKHTNRLYLQNDQDNTKFPGLDSLSNELNTINPDLLVIGGFQLMNQKPYQEYEEIILKLSKLLQKNSGKLLKHFEMGGFTDPQLFQFIVENIFPYIDSTGMNEQELYLFYNFLMEGTIPYYTEINVSEQIKMVVDLQRIIGTKRIHFHSQNIQMICSLQDNKLWGNKARALLRSVQVGLNQAMKSVNDNQIEPDSINYKDVHVNIEEEIIELYPTTRWISAEKLTHDKIACWQYDDEQECCITPVLIHSQPQRTSGLGDNIAATSLLSQLINYNIKN